MELKRRGFLKIVGGTALAGAGAASVLFKGPDSAMAAHHGGHGGDEAGEQAARHVEDMPGSGTRWAMVIDVRKCMEQGDCNDCINVCHFVHNVPHFKDPKEEVKWLWHDEYEHVFPDISTLDPYAPDKIKKHPFLLLCNHCDNPPCVRVCPTKATFRRPDGIVAMDYHRCIGCRFCMAACPYGSRSFNWRDPRLGLKGRKLNYEFPTRMRGVVEKCNFCVERLAQGKQPACVEACKCKALTFGNLADPGSEVRAILRENYALRRKPHLGTKPSVFYIIG